MLHFNWVDYTVLAIFLISILIGLSRGLAREIISLLTLIAAFVVAILFSNTLATVFTHSATVQNMVNQASSSVGENAVQSVSYLALGVSFIILFVGTIIVGAIIGFILNLALQTGIVGFGNRLLGGIFGFCRGFIMNLVLIFVIQLTGLSSQSWWHESYFVNLYQPVVQWLGNLVSPSLAHLKEKFGKTFENVNSELQTLGSPSSQSETKSNK